MAEAIKDPTEPTGEIKHRTGTPAYMARAVRNLNPPSGLFELPPMAAVNPGLEGTYHRILRDRHVDFDESKPEIFRIAEETEYKEPFCHQLRFDAESVFWVLLWWSIQAQPKKPSALEPIEPTAWASLVDTNDTRNENFIRELDTNTLHSTYQPLYKLLNGMRKYLEGDLAFAKTGKRGHSEYLHEAFQRCILNFLFENDTKPFMDVEKDEESRTVAATGMQRKPTGTTTKLIMQATRKMKRKEEEEKEEKDQSHKKRHIE